MTKDTKTKSKLLERIVWGVMLLSFVFGVFTLGFYVREWTLPDTVKELDYILELIEENYVGEFDRDEFISSAVSGTLDRYSTYYTADEYEQVMLSRDGLASGKIGISFQGESNKIVAVAGNSSAERAGIVEGGYVTGIKLKADGELTVISSYAEFNSKYKQINE